MANTSFKSWNFEMWPKPKPTGNIIIHTHTNKTILSSYEMEQ